MLSLEIVEVHKMIGPDSHPGFPHCRGVFIFYLYRLCYSLHSLRSALCADCPSRPYPCISLRQEAGYARWLVVARRELDYPLVPGPLCQGGSTYL